VRRGPRHAELLLGLAARGGDQVDVGRRSAPPPGRAICPEWVGAVAPRSIIGTQVWPSRSTRSSGDRRPAAASGVGQAQPRVHREARGQALDQLAVGQQHLGLRCRAGITRCTSAGARG
jgi:hypothetical protein